MVSGVSIPAYWLSTWIWDVMSFQPTVWLLAMLIVVFPKTELLGTGSAFNCVIGLLILFGTSVSSFSYLLSFLFSTSAGAQIGILFIVIILGLVMSIVGAVLRILPNTHDIYMSVVRYIFLLFPPLAFGEALRSIVLIDLLSYSELTPGLTYEPTDMAIAGLPLLYLGIESFAYLFATIFLDYAINTPLLQSLLCGNVIVATDASKF